MVGMSQTIGSLVVAMDISERENDSSGEKVFVDLQIIEEKLVGHDHEHNCFVNNFNRLVGRNGIDVTIKNLKPKG